jgi:hypothetical protein
VTVAGSRAPVSISASATNRPRLTRLPCKDFIGPRLAFHGSGNFNAKACLQGGVVRMAAGIWTVVPAAALLSQARD